MATWEVPKIADKLKSGESSTWEVPTLSEKIKQGTQKASPASMQVNLNGEAWTRATPSQTRVPAMAQQNQQSGRSDGKTVEKPTMAERVVNAVYGAAKGIASDLSSAMTTRYQVGQAERTARNQELLAEYQRNLERAQRDLRAMQEANAKQPGTCTDDELRSQQYIVEDAQRKYDAMKKVLAENIQEKATEASHGVTGQLAEGSAADLEKAKAGLGTLGRGVVDFGVAGLQLGGDIAASKILGTGALIPMAERVFGGGAREARQDGATLGQQVAYGSAKALTSVATEQISNVVKPFAKAFGAGMTDDVLETAIAKAVDRFARTAAGKTALEAVLKTGAGFVSEGGEEAVEDLVDPLLKLIYQGDNAKSLAQNIAASYKQNLDPAEVVYDFLIGGALGGLGGAVEGVTSAKGKYKGYQTEVQNTAIERAYDTMKEKGVFSQEARRAVRDAEDIMPKLDVTMESNSAGQNSIGRSFSELVQDITPKLVDEHGRTAEVTDMKNEPAVRLTENGVELTGKVKENTPLTSMIRDHIGDMNTMQPVAEVRGTEIQNTGEKLVDRLVNFTKSIGNKVVRPGFGEVLFSKGRIKSSMIGHGVGQIKIDVFSAVPDVIRAGQQIDFQKNWKGRNYDTYTFAAPITYKGDRTYLGVIVTKDSASSRYYLHEVVDADGNIIFKNENPVSTSDGTSALSGDLDTVVDTGNPADAMNTSALDNTLARGADSVKNSEIPDIAPKLVDEHGMTAEEKARYLDALAQDENAPDTRKENRPTRAKKELKQDILNLFSVQAGKRAELGKVVELAGDEMLRSGKLTEETRTAMFDALYGAGVVVQDADPAYKAVRDTLKGRRIYVDKSVKAELGDDWNSVRARAMGNGFYLTTDPSAGTAVDVMQNELAETVGRGMIDEMAAQSDALLRMIDLAEMGKPAHISLAEEAENIGKQYGEGMAEDQVNNLIRQTDEAMRRFAEKAGLEIDLKDRADTMVEKERQRWRDMQTRKSERKRQSEAARTTQRNLRFLRKRLGFNDSRLSEALNSMSENDRAIAESALQNIETDTLRLTEERREKLQKNAQLYEELLALDPNYIPDKETLADLEKMDREYLANKSVEELFEINHAVQRLRTHLANINETIGRETHEKFDGLYKAAKAEIQSSKGRYPKGKIAGKVSDFMDSQMTPMNYMEMLGGWDEKGTWYSFAKDLEAGERGKKRFTVEANNIFKEFREQNADWIAKSDGQGKNAIWYEIEMPELLGFDAGDKPMFGDTIKVKLTPAMKVELARGIRSYDNLRHAEGGVTFPDPELYSKGERKEAYGRGTTIKLAPETMKKMFSYESLTPQEKQLFKLGDEFFDGMAKKAINETSQKLDGIDRAISDHYSKIYTDTSYRVTDATKIDQSIGGMGSLQRRVQSKAPMLAMSMWEAYSDTVDTVGKYANMSVPVRDMDMLFNWMESGRNESMKDVLNKQWGLDSSKYVEDLLTSLQNKQAPKKSGVDHLADALLNNYVTATFGMNPGIVLKQATSFPSAAAVLGFDTVPTPKQLAHVDTDLIARYSPELEYRSMGYATPELAELKNNPNWTQRNKATRFLFGGAIQAMDRATVSRMWPWAENAVKKNYPDLKAGSDAFYKKTAELFEKAVSETQPMYDEMHRANIMKGQSGITRAFTMFKTVPLQQQNMIRKAWNEAKATGSDEAKKRLRATVASLVVATLGYEGVEFANQLWKNMGKHYRDDDDELTAESVAKTIAENSVKDLAGTVVGGKELADALTSGFTGNKYYDVEMPGLSQLNELMETVENTAKTVKKVNEDVADLRKNGGSVQQYAEDHAAEVLGYVKDTAQLLSEYAAGVPVSNLEKYVLGTIQWTSPELKEAYESIWEDTKKKDLTGLKGEALYKRVSDLMDRRANVSESTKRELARIYETVGSDIIPSEIPGSLTIDEEKTTLSETMKQKYGSTYKQTVSGGLDAMIQSKGYQNMTDEQKVKAIGMLYSYAKGKAEEASVGKELSGGAVKAERIQKAGGSLTDYIWFATTAPSKSGEALRHLDGSGLSDASKVSIYMNAVLSDEKREQQEEMEREYGITDADYYKYSVAMNGASKKAEKLQALSDSGLSAKKQANIYFGTIASESEQKAQESAEDQGISKDTYFQYLVAAGDATKKAEKLEAVNSLDLTVAQKDAMYYALGYSAKNIYTDAPWYDITPKLTGTGSSKSKSNGKTATTQKQKVLNQFAFKPKWKFGS